MSKEWQNLIPTNESTFPLIVRARTPALPIAAALPEIKMIVANFLSFSGAILFRGFEIKDPADFHTFTSGFEYPVKAYDFGSTPRSAVSEGVYTSTEYPASQHIPLHNEQSYTREWAMKLWFYCMNPAITGGETPIADSRKVLSSISPSIREHFVRKGLMYVRNYGNGLDVPWQKVFGTINKQEVEAYCSAKAIQCQWKSDGELRTRQICQVTETHPLTGEEVWFNQAHLFHISGLEQGIRETLLDVVGLDELPRNVYHADGSALDVEMLNEIRTALKECAVPISWQKHDVVMIDNMLTAHGRNPFTGNRKVFVAMADPHSNLDAHRI